MFKRNRVIMLPTNEKAKIGDIIQCNNPHKSRIAWKNKLGICSFHDDENVITEWQPIHLNIISNEEIKEGDWCYDELRICLWRKTKEITCNGEIYHKIIATTDKSLGLPQPSQSFIQKYVSEYNKGNIITEMMIEYENSKPYSTSGKEFGSKEFIEANLQVKVDKDNTITIKKVKDSWSREEVMVLLNKCWIQATKKTIEPLTESGFSKWIEEYL